MAVDRRRRGEDDGGPVEGRQQLGDLGEVARHQVAPALVERLPGHVRQEVGPVVEATAVRAVHERPVVEAVHLVDGHLVQALGVLLERVEQGHRFAVGERDDDVGARRDVVQDGCG